MTLSFWGLFVDPNSESMYLFKIPYRTMDIEASCIQCFFNFTCDIKGTQIAAICSSLLAKHMIIDLFLSSFYLFYYFLFF